MVNKTIVNKTVTIEFPRFRRYSRGAIEFLIRLALTRIGSVVLPSGVFAQSLQTRIEKIVYGRGYSTSIDSPLVDQGSR